MLLIVIILDVGKLITIQNDIIILNLFLALNNPTLEHVTC